MPGFVCTIQQPNCQKSSYKLTNQQLLSQRGRVCLAWTAGGGGLLCLLYLRMEKTQVLVVGQ